MHCAKGYWTIYQRCLTDIFFTSVCFYERKCQFSTHLTFILYYFFWMIFYWHVPKCYKIFNHNLQDYWQKNQTFSTKGYLSVRHHENVSKTLLFVHILMLCFVSCCPYNWLCLSVLIYVGPYRPRIVSQIKIKYYSNSSNTW